MMPTTIDDVIDLHAHTICSDGSVTPRELVDLARAKRARAIAITDHDTVAGLREGRAAAEQLGIEFVNGIEISADYSPGTMHILGYCIDDECDELLMKLEELRSARETRNPQIASRLQALGCAVTYEEVAALAGNEVVGRPHFARVLVQKRCAESIQDAFDRFLAKGAPAYVEKARLSPEESIQLIHRARGVAVLAHPYQLKLPSLDAAFDLISDLAALGLDGVEAIYSRHSPAERERYAEMARKKGLIVTGGSDYHGSYKPDLDIVTGKGDLAVPYSLLGEVKARVNSTVSGGRLTHAG